MKSNRYNICIKCDSYEYETSDRIRIRINEDDPYSNNDTRYDHNLKGYYISNNKEVFDFILDQNIEKIGYLVYALYDTGDSLHRTKNLIKYIHFTYKFEEAQIIKKALKDDYKEYEKTKEHNYKPLELNIDDKKLSISTGSWKGYFESLNNIEAQPLLLLTV